jgi:hypothetical protein
MVVTVDTSIAASELITGIVVGACLALGVMMFALDDKQRTAVAAFSRNVSIFMIPLVVLVAYIVIIWAANILAR